MNYYRLYPSKNNTLVSSGKPIDKFEKINLGKMTIMELHDGRINSELIFKFEVPDYIKNNFELLEEVNFVLFDAGAIQSNVIGSRTIKISRFVDDFNEGNGFYLSLEDGLYDNSNFQLAKFNTPWVSKDNEVEFVEFDLDSYEDDIKVDILPLIKKEDDFFCLKVKLKDNSFLNDSKVKFMFSRHSNTIYKPFIECKVNNVINDNRYNFKRGENNTIFLIGEGITNANLTCVYNRSELTVQSYGEGINFVEFQPEPTDELVKLEWFLSGEKIHQDIINILPNFTLNSKNLNEVEFYINTFTPNNATFRKGDIIKFDIMSFIPGVNNFVYADYEYRIVTNTGFEMLPWTKCNNYLENIFFLLNTSYFYNELNYEISLRMNHKGIIRTNKENFKFKLINQSGNQLHEFSSNPFYTKDWFFSAK